MAADTFSLIIVVVLILLFLVTLRFLGFRPIGPIRAARMLAALWTSLRLRAQCPHPDHRRELYYRKWRAGMWIYCWECERWIGESVGLSTRRRADL